MRHTLLAAPLFLIAALPANAESPFDGTWKIDTGAAKFDPKPDVMSLQDGRYVCSSCVPSYSVAADGMFHEIPGHPYADAVSISVTGPRSIVERDRKNGRTIGEATSTVSNDSQTLATHFVDRSAPNGKVVTGDSTETRVSAAPSGAHPISGSWRQQRVSGVSTDGLTFSIRIDGNTVHYAAGTGEHADGPLGTYLPLVGDVGGTSIRYERVDARTLRGTSRRAGKVVSIATITVSPDGRTLTNASHDVVHGTDFVGKAVKQ